MGDLLSSINIFITILHQHTIQTAMLAQQVKNMPIKICYLRDQSKPEPQPKQQKLSVAYLSSILQNEKKPKTASNQHSLIHSNINLQEQEEDPFIKMDYITETPHKKISKTHHYQQRIHETDPMKAYTQWNRIKSRSHKDDQRLLNNLLGEDWENGDKVKQQKISKRFNYKVKTQKTITKREPSYDQKKLKNANEHMLHEHFQTFLKNQKNSNTNERGLKDNPNFFIGKIDERLESINNNKSKKLGRISHNSLIETNTNFHSKNSSLFKEDYYQNIKPKTTSNLRIIFSSDATRTGFKHIQNFEWSKLNKNQKYKLEK